jgi:hypothetical protein
MWESPSCTPLRRWRNPEAPDPVRCICTHPDREGTCELALTEHWLPRTAA